MKKFFAATICLILTVVSLVTFCACGAILNSAWESVGLDKSTVKLPDLKLSSVSSVKSKDKISLTIVWNGGTREAFDDLAEQCYTNIPANLDESGNTISSAEEAIKEYDQMMVVFNAMYQKSGDTYYCTLVLFNADNIVEDVIYKSGQLVLILEKQVVQVGNKNSWSIDSDDKTWFTEEELSDMGFDGLEAPKGVILGKLVEELDNSILYKMSIEVSDIKTYDDFIKVLFEEYSVNINNKGQVVEDYHDDYLYFYKNPDLAWFNGKFNVGEKQGGAQISWDHGHIVIQISVNKSFQ